MRISRTCFHHRFNHQPLHSISRVPKSTRFRLKRIAAVEVKTNLFSLSRPYLLYPLFHEWAQIELVLSGRGNGAFGRLLGGFWAKPGRPDEGERKRILRIARAGGSGYISWAGRGGALIPFNYEIDADIFSREAARDD